MVVSGSLRRVRRYGTRHRSRLSLSTPLVDILRLSPPRPRLRHTLLYDYGNHQHSPLAQRHLALFRRFHDPGKTHRRHDFQSLLHHCARSSTNIYFRFEVCALHENSVSRNIQITLPTTSCRLLSVVSLTLIPPSLSLPNSTAPERPSHAKCSPPSGPPLSKSPP